MFPGARDDDTDVAFVMRSILVHKPLWSYICSWRGLCRLVSWLWKVLGFRWRCWSLALGRSSQQAGTFCCSRHRRPDCWSSRADNMLHFRAALECFMHAISRPEDPFLDQSWTLLANQHSNKLQVGSRRKVRQHLMLIFQANSPRINPK